jgi:gluconokinase
LASEAHHSAIIVMGVCGVGKSSVGRTLAERLGARYIEADDFHSEKNRATMEQGVPLSDQERLPWLREVADAAEKVRQDETVVLACSALKLSYRDLLREIIGKVQFVFLNGDRDLLAKRIINRTDHFMPISLLDSQIATLDPPTPEEDAVDVDVAPPKSDVDNVVEQLVRTKINNHYVT